MRIAFKAFNKDLTCTLGKRIVRYEPGKWFEEPEANCVQNGFHSAENPLDCLTYYSDMASSVYYAVAVDGDVDEDSSDSKISCTRIKLLKELSLEQFVFYAMDYMAKRPMMKTHSKVKRECSASADNGFTIVRGKNPIAKGKKGTVVGLLKEKIDSPEITDMNLFVIDGENYLEDRYYNVLGKCVN